MGIGIPLLHRHHGNDSTRRQNQLRFGIALDFFHRRARRHFNQVQTIFADIHHRQIRHNPRDAARGRQRQLAFFYDFEIKASFRCAFDLGDMFHQDDH